MNDLVGGDSDGSFNTSPYVSCTPDGVCMAGLIGLFLGADTDASDVSNYHTGIFRMSEDHGASWGGCNGSTAEGCADSFNGDGYYFIPDGVWDELVASFEESVVEDECEGTTHVLDDFWSYYDADFKVDKNGIIHASIGKVSFDSIKIEENAVKLIDSVIKLKPSTTKGNYFKSISISSTMSSAVKIDKTSISDL